MNIRLSYLYFLKSIYNWLFIIVLLGNCKSNTSTEYNEVNNPGNKIFKIDFDEPNNEYYTLDPEEESKFLQSDDLCYDNNRKISGMLKILDHIESNDFYNKSSKEFKKNLLGSLPLLTNNTKLTFNKKKLVL